MNRFYYFLFGETLSELYRKATNIQQVVDRINEGNCDWGIYRYDEEKDFPSSLILVAQQWRDFADISEEEYDLLLPLLIN